MKKIADLYFRLLKLLAQDLLQSLAGPLLMLFVTWLILSGSWQQAQINLDVVAPASGLSMAWFYGVGVVFGVSAGLILLHELFLAITGRLNPDELVTLKDGEAADEIEHPHQQPATAGRNA